MRIGALKNRATSTLIALLFAIVWAGNHQSMRAQAAQPVPEEDTQWWNEVQVAVALNKAVDFNLISAIRIGRDITHLTDRRVGAGFSFKFGEYLTVTPWYLNIDSRPAEGRKTNENRLSLAATVRFPAGKFIVSDRNLVERRIRSPLSSTRYRNRFQIDRPVKFGSTPITLFASDEVFYDWSVDDWVRNRFSAGISRRFNKHFTGDLYYLRQNDGRTRPGDLHVLGVTYRVRL